MNARSPLDLIITKTQMTNNINDKFILTFVCFIQVEINENVFVDLAGTVTPTYFSKLEDDLGCLLGLCHVYVMWDERYRWERFPCL